jgi:hypothetical protein
MLSELEEDSNKVEFVTASYKTNRIINSVSLENTPSGVFDLKISHHFGPLGDGFETFFGLDNAATRLGADYGINDWLQIGLGRTTFQKTWDSYFKVKLIRQKTGAVKQPLAVQWFSSMAIDATPDDGSNQYEYFTSRMSFVHQLILGSKISEALTFQIMPSLVHRNLVETKEERNDVFALGFGGRAKLTNRLAFTAEYYYVFPDQLADRYTNSISFGVDIETGGHVFQLFVTNSVGIIEQHVITQTPGQNGDFDMRIGFNISRVFTVRKPKEFR